MLDLHNYLYFVRSTITMTLIGNIQAGASFFWGEVGEQLPAPDFLYCPALSFSHNFSALLVLLGMFLAPELSYGFTSEFYSQLHAIELKNMFCLSNGHSALGIEHK